jgi:amino acid adenylation domain-containing protein
LPLTVTTQATRLPQAADTGRPARIGVSSFGFSGTNAHVIVEGYPTEPPASSVASTRRHRVLALSAKSPSALSALCGRCAEWLSAAMSAAPDPSALLADAAYTAAVGRSHFGARAGIAFAGPEDLAGQLATLARAGEPSLRSGRVGEAATGLRPESASAPRIAFLFTGQGSQWAGMGRELYATEPVFRAVLDRCEKELREVRGASLLDVLFGAEGAAGTIDDTAWTQPGLYALQAGLVALWASLGVRPVAVLGHSVGEIAAAHAAGVLGLEAGLRLAALRGALMGRLPAGGAMAAVFAPPDRVAAMLAGQGGLSLAAANGAHQVVAGPAAAVEALASRLGGDGVRVERLRTSHAFHSALMEPMLAALEAAVAGLEIEAPGLTLISNVTGRAVAATERLDATYWRRHAREAVQFARGVAALSTAGIDLTIEIGPHGVLGPMAALAWPGTAPSFVASLRRNVPSDAAFADAVAAAYAAGAPLAFAGLFAGEARAKVELPGYPFERQRHWFEAPAQRPAAEASGGPAADAGGPAAAGLGKAAPDERGALLLALVRSEAQAVLGLAAPPPPDLGLFELGMDSLLAVRLAARLEAATGQPVGLRRVLEAPTAAGVAAAIAAAWAEPEGEGAIGPADRSGPLPLSYQQERLWFLDRLDAAAGRAYHIEGALRLEGALDVAALARALAAVVERHEALRTRFGLVDGRPTQLILESAESGFALELEEAPRLGDGGVDGAGLAARLDALLGRRFDLATMPPFRATLLRLSAEEHVLVVGGHHIVLDGWSVGLLMREVSALYRAKAPDAGAGLPPLPAQYADYSAWQRRVLSGERLASETGWWKAQLAGTAAAITLPFDRPRPPAMDYRGGSAALAIPAALLSRLKDLARREGATPFMVLEAAFAVLLHRIGGDEDLVVGTAVAGRPRVELEGLAGFFVNTVALRHRIAGPIPFADLLRATRRVVLDAFEHQAVPFEAVVDAVRPARSLGHAPILQVMLVVQNTPDASPPALDGIQATWLDTDGGTAQFELSLVLAETADGMAGRLGYAMQLFDAPTAERLARMYVRLLEAIVTAPETAIDALPLMSATELERVVRGFNETAVAFPRDRTILDLFGEHAAQAPRRVAVLDGEEEVRYGALDAASSRLARHLIGLGVGPETVVGVCLERSAGLVVALLAIWKAGGAYLPLDPDYPAERIAFKLADAGAGLALTSTRLAPRLGPEPGALSILRLDEPAIAAAIARQPGHGVTEAERLVPLTADSLAYVIYTSGSTGRPKGVLVDHRSYANFLLASIEDFGLGPESVILSLAASGFDVCMQEFGFALGGGGRLVLGDRRRLMEPGYFGGIMTAHGITLLDTTPTLWRAVLAEGWRPDRPMTLISGAEAMPPDLARALGGGGARWFNVYGPTEATITATCQQVTGAETSVPIGRPLANTCAYVVDDHLVAQPVGVPGELVIGGVQVARGYLGRPGLTAERFVADPFSGVPGARLYRTGDLARWRADGTLEFLGRIDAQIKIRGMRVELGEIEAALQLCPGVSQAAVATRDAGLDARLVAYLVPVGAATEGEPQVISLENVVDLEAVWHQLRRILPEHMLPSGFVGLTSLPLSPSGKVDRKALPAAEASLARTAYAGPATATEQLVAASFGDLLGVERVGRGDGFFALGGHSLLAIRLAARLEAATGRAIAVRTVFEAPTVAELAAALDAATAPSYRRLLRFAARSRARSERARIYCFHPASGQATVYHPLVAPLHGVAEPIGVQARGVAAAEAPFDLYPDMLDAYAEEIAADLRGAPAIMLGWSYGGHLAHDVACRLAAAGQPVAGVVLLDSVEQALDGTLPADPARLGAWQATAERIAGTMDREEQLRLLAAVAPELSSADLPDDPRSIAELARLWHRNETLLAQRSGSGRFAGPALVVRAADTRSRIEDPALGWSAFCGRVAGRDVPFGHFDLLRPEPASVIGGLVAQWLAAELAAPAAPPAAVAAAE